jgi:hypothetical protein
MSMYKRPLPRVRNAYTGDKPLKFIEGSYLHGLVDPGQTTYFKFHKGPVYNKEIYLRMLKHNYEVTGVTYIEPILPESIKFKKIEPLKEPELTYADIVYVNIRILKSGVVRIKLDASIATLHEKYYSKGKRPPSKNIIQAYKSMGFSDRFLEKIKINFSKKEKEQKRIEGVIEKLFNKEPVKKVKKKKEEVKVIDVDVDVDVELIEEEKVDEEDEEDDAPGEDDGLDVEPDPEEDVEEEPTEEEYLSD